MMKRHYWAQYRTTEFAPKPGGTIDPDKTIAVLPTAAIEQHGPHLPVGVDTMIQDGMLATLCSMMPDDLDIRILPTQAIGKSNEHLHAPGTLTLTAQQVLSAWVEIGRSVARAGVRKLVIVNSHGGNLDLINVIARELRVELNMLCARTQWATFGTPDDMPGGPLTADEQRYGIHGGDVETSLMLHFHPDLVDLAQAKDFKSSAAHTPVKPTGLPSYGWIASDLNKDGTVGDASKATAARGEAIARHQAMGFINTLRQVRDFDLGHFAA
ncbi:MAG: creatininase family protein [Pseudomonadota bacterium]